MFPVCNLLTRTKEPGSVVRGKPDLPRFSYVELTLKLDKMLNLERLAVFRYCYGERDFLAVLF
ncbi:hypothetical protein [Leptospira kirschneri]|uniref:hypothetical protein n=1 Tax=Leptospira kirschneri TaxID=29507 RepID=UPI000519188B|nr:hypothetical protein [Leptospira kirschneri]